VRACRWVLECPHLAPSLTRSIALPIDDRSFSLCLHWMAGPLPVGRPGLEVQRGLLEQVAAAQTCDEALQAVWVEDIDPDTDARCAGFGNSYQCEDDVATDCVDGTVTRCDSPRFAPGAECMQTPPPPPVLSACASGTCVSDPEQLGSCADEIGTLCIANLAVDVPCAPLGLRCGNPEVFCAPEGAFGTDCTGPGNARCAAGDKRVQVCAGKLLASDYDCTAIESGSCAADGPARCVRPGAACTILAADAGADGGSTLGAGVDVCNGNSLRACVDGQAIAIDCGEGLACLPASNGISGRCGTAPE
jgi:hypothetical protein